MKIRPAVCVASFAALLAAAGGAQAQNCGSFTDVLQSDGACGAIQWVKNRSITLGCTSLTTYCPTDSVTRAQMALFLQRQAAALAPFHHEASSGGGALLINTNDLFVACQTLDLPATPYPRTAKIRGIYAGTITSSTAPFWMFLMYDGEPFGTWTSANSNRLVVPAGTTGFLPLTWVAPPVTIPANVQMRFAIGLSLVSGASGQVAGGAYSCTTEVTVDNLNGSSPPFDE